MTAHRGNRYSFVFAQIAGSGPIKTVNVRPGVRYHESVTPQQLVQNSG